MMKEFCEVSKYSFYNILKGWSIFLNIIWLKITTDGQRGHQFEQELGMIYGNVYGLAGRKRRGEK